MTIYYTKVLIKYRARKTDTGVRFQIMKGRNQLTQCDTVGCINISELVSYKFTS